jgi:hypothetical protein
MKEVYFETEDAILRFSHDDVVERLPYFESNLDATQATTLRDLLSQSDLNIRIRGSRIAFSTSHGISSKRVRG